MSNGDPIVSRDHSICATHHIGATNAFGFKQLLSDLAEAPAVETKCIPKAEPQHESAHASLQQQCDFSHSCEYRRRDTTQGTASRQALAPIDWDQADDGLTGRSPSSSDKAQGGEIHATLGRQPTTAGDPPTAPSDS
jgi:hypothetical protein